MARYKLLAPAVIDGAVREAGEEIEFDGIPGRHMQPLDKKGKEVPAPVPLDPMYLAYRQDRSIPGDPGVFTGFYGFGLGSPPSNVDVPYVSGTPAFGETLTCTMGNWEGEPTSYAYAWKRDETVAIGTDSNTYVVSGDDAGSDITCIVTASNAAGSTAAPPSNAISIGTGATADAAEAPPSRSSPSSREKK